MEQAKKLLVAESRFDWDDVGSWTAVEHHFPQDDSGNTVVGGASLTNTSGAVVLNASNNHRLVVAGLKDVVVVQTPTATLVCSRDQLKNLRSIVRNALA